ncbi:hypothetical protein GGX14DRAFT_618474, partial [Mycena pura]
MSSKSPLSLRASAVPTGPVVPTAIPHVVQLYLPPARARYAHSPALGRVAVANAFMELPWRGTFAGRHAQRSRGNCTLTPSPSSPNVYTFTLLAGAQPLSPLGDHCSGRGGTWILGAMRTFGDDEDAQCVAASTPCVGATPLPSTPPSYIGGSSAKASSFSDSGGPTVDPQRPPLAVHHRSPLAASRRWLPPAPCPLLTGPRPLLADLCPTLATPRTHCASPAARRPPQSPQCFAHDPRPDARCLPPHASRRSLPAPATRSLRPRSARIIAGVACTQHAKRTAARRQPCASIVLHTGCACRPRALASHCSRSPASRFPFYANRRSCPPHASTSGNTRRTLPAAGAIAAAALSACCLPLRAMSNAARPMLHARRSTR